MQFLDVVFALGAGRSAARLVILSALVDADNELPQSASTPISVVGGAGAYDTDSAPR